MMVGRPSRDKGARFERELVRRFRPVWPEITRTQGGVAQLGGDFDNTDDWAVEAKHQAVWRIPEWVRKLEQQTNEGCWILVVASDRVRPPHGTYAVVPLDILIDLLAWRGR